MKQHPKIWIDLENTPHVPFFLPIILELEREGCEVILTARDFAQTVDLVERAGLTARVVGSESGRAMWQKGIALSSRAAKLAWILRGRGIALAVGHGSRGLLLASKILGIPSLTLYDYEGASVSLFNKLSSYVLTPDAIPFSTLAGLGLPKLHHLQYPGMKEEVYATDFIPDDAICDELKLDRRAVIVTIRPPSLTAHYRTDSSLLLFEEIMSSLTRREDVQIILTPRNPEQRRQLQTRYGSAKNVIIPPHAVDGLNLLYHSDVVIGGGGTMNREAAVLGVPVLSIFKGPVGAVDRSLIDQGRMIEINSARELGPHLHKREHDHLLRPTTRARDAIVDVILNLARR